MAPEDRDSPACPRLLGGGAGWDGLGTPSLTGCPVPVGERRSGALGSLEQSTPPFKHHLHPWAGLHQVGLFWSSRK